MSSDQIEDYRNIFKILMGALLEKISLAKSRNRLAKNGKINLKKYGHLSIGLCGKEST